MQRHLLVLRHAKSDWSSPSGTDHDRPLNKRGLRAAAHIGKALSSERFRPQLIVTSSATRARMTAEIVAEHCGVESEPEVRGSLYGAGVDGWLEQARATDESIDSLLIVGHEPTCSEVVRALAGVEVVYPTAGLTSLAVNTTWSELGTDRCYLEYFLIPRLIAPLLKD